MPAHRARSLLNLLWPCWCLCCGLAGPSLCDDCAATLFEAQWRDAPPTASFAPHRGLARDLLLSAKYAPDLPLARRMGTLLAQRFPAPQGALVTWVPPHDRGGGSSLAAMAQAYAGVCGCDLGPLARWRRPTPRQTSQATERGREALPKDSFVFEGPLTGTLVILDDVITTGATMAALRTAALAAGAVDVRGLTWTARAKSTPGHFASLNGGSSRGC